MELEPSTSMPASARKKKPAAEETPRKSSGGLDRLLSGKVETAKKRKKSRKKEAVVELLPEPLRRLSDVMTAGRKVEKELSFKIRYSEQKIKDHCIRRFCENYAAAGHRPASAEYAGNHSRFTFVQTRKLYLTSEKVEALKMMGVPIDDYTALTGLTINYDAIRQHHLEFKLRTALQRLEVPEEVLDEIFQPRVEVKEQFMEVFNTVVERSLGPKEELADKMYEVIRILQPVNQIKATDPPDLTPLECFKLVENAKIATADEDEDSAA